MGCYTTYFDTPDGSILIGYYDNLVDVRYEFPSKWFEVYHQKDGIHIRRKTWKEVKEMQE